MNQLFSNIIYNNSIINTRNNNSRTIINPLANTYNNYRNNSNNRQNFFLSWRNNTNLNNQIQPTNRLNDNEIIENVLNEPILSVPLNTSVPENLNNSNSNVSQEYEFAENFLETTLYNEDNSNNVVMQINYINNDNNENQYYSTFAYNNYNIRFNHESLLNPSDADYVFQNILSNIFEEELINNSLNNNSPQTNNFETIEQIKENINEDLYENIKDILKNDICPISMESFLNNDTICMFTNCKHGIHIDNKDQFVKLFNKCPLCNISLI